MKKMKGYHFYLLAAISAFIALIFMVLRRLEITSDLISTIFFAIFMLGWIILMIIGYIKNSEDMKNIWRDLK